MKPELSEILFIKEIYSKANNANQKFGELVNIDRLTGDASTRRYYRIECQRGSVVICLDNPIKDNEEYNFLKVQIFLSGFNIRVPQIYDHSNTKGFLIEEDLGDITMLSYLSDLDSKASELECYKKCIDEILKMHKIENQIIKNEIPLSFDYKKLMDEMNFTLNFFIKRFLKFEDQAEIDNLSKHLVGICERLSNEKMVFTHRDFHSRNVMVKNDEFIIIDFQDARHGIPQYDLTSLLEDCYYELDVENKENLKRYYYDNLDQEIHGQKDYGNFEALYDDMLIQRVFKAIGSFSYIYFQRDDHRYLKYIGFAMEKLKRTFLKNKKYDDLRKTLFKIYYAS